MILPIVMQQANSCGDRSTVTIARDKEEESNLTQDGRLGVDALVLDKFGLSQNGQGGNRI